MSTMTDKTRIGLVASCLNTEHIRGMGKYVFELLQQSKPEHGLDWVLFGDDPRYPMTVPPGMPLTRDVFEFKGDRFRLWEQLGLPLRAIKRDVDLLHCTEGTLSLWQPRPTVVTVHDTLSWEERPDTRGAAFYFDTVLPAALKKCAAVITISESSRHDILQRWPCLDAKLSVIPHGIDAPYFEPLQPAVPGSLQTNVGDSPYLVYLGGAMERKRFAWAVGVLANSPHADLKLVVCGFGSAARRLAAEQLPTVLRQRVHFAEFLSDAELRSLYKGARAVLYPTLYEGFGFPAVEAQAAGVPVIFSPLGSLKELIGPLALVVPPDDLGAWLAAVNTALAMTAPEAHRAQELTATGQAWARQFSWSESYAKHLAVYQRVRRQAGKPTQ